MKATKTTAYLGLKTRTGAQINEQIVIASKLKQFGICGATINRVTGYWEGTLEDSLALTVIADKPVGSFFRNVATIYCHDFENDAVLIEVSEVDTDLVTCVKQI